jgi:mannose-6-phosphate isomerase-like protein (cupin superfamily)
VRPVVVPPDAGRELRTPGGADVVIKLSAQATGGAMTIFETAEEVFVVIAGAYVFELDDVEHAAPAGTIVFLPRGTRHRFRSVGHEPGRVLSFTTPGGIDRLFEAVG